MEAAALARRGEAVQPGAAWLRRERARLAVRAGHWSDALALADADAPKAALATAAAEAETDPGRALRLAKQAWQEDPSLAPAALAYAARLRAAGRESRALTVIRHSWSIAPQPNLADFALALVSDKLQRTQAAQRLTEANPEHAETRLLLARTALEAGLTGEARRATPRPPLRQGSISVGCGYCWPRSRRRRAATQRPGVWRSAMPCAMPRPPIQIRRGGATPAIPHTRRGTPIARTASPSAACAGAQLPRRRHASCCRTVPRS